MILDAPPAPMILSEQDLWLFGEGNFIRAYQKLGAHVGQDDGRQGCFFAVWAPNAKAVSVVGEFNDWNAGAHRLSAAGSSGMWQGFAPGAGHQAAYRYVIEPRDGGAALHKADPYAFFAQLRPGTASRIWDLGRYAWSDADWMRRRGDTVQVDRPISVYEVHLGSWRRRENGQWLTYRELAEELPAYAQEMGFTHVEFLPPCEHPYDGSWGYQTTGYFAPTSRFGTPDEFRHLIDRLHQAGLGVLMDWVPAHFPVDAHGLGLFDGTHLYEHEDPRLGAHPEWNTLIFNYQRPQVCNFLLSSALFWLEQYHIDGFRVDAVASMLYLDYARKPGEWVPNRYGRRENLEAIDFIRKFNETVYREHPDAVTIAEESTAWQNVSRPTFTGGLGFGYKWDMGWMHDTLAFLTLDAKERPAHQNELTFRALYAFSENYMMPLSHDEVGRGQGSLWRQAPGDERQKMAALRLLFGYQFAQPGKKLLFMGDEFGQRGAWNYEQALEWERLSEPAHQGLKRWVRDLNRTYRHHECLHARDCDPSGFEVIDFNNPGQCVVSFLRKGAGGEAPAVVVCNFLPEARPAYRVGAPLPGPWTAVLNSDADVYGGSCQGQPRVATENVSWNNRPQSVLLDLPPLSIQVLMPV